VFKRAMILLVNLITHGNEEIREPESLIKAQSLPQWELWKEVIQKEYDALIVNDTWKLVPLSKGKKAIRGKWVFKIKDYNEDGELIRRFKARWVAKGFLQKYGVDFDQTWASVVGYDRIRSLMVYGTHT
jgi:hypothetical protein